MKKLILAFVSVLWFNMALHASENKLEDKEVVTQHAVKIGGKEVKYKAIIGKCVIRDDKSCDKAAMSYIAYEKEGVKDLSTRPITFCFNGGPGSSSVWLHIGAYGPKKIALSDAGEPLIPYRLEENPYSILDLTDLVFIDPVSTGYSRPAPDEEAKKFHTVDEDVKSVAELIRLYITKRNRWSSPKYISGESYGTTRAAALVNNLQDEKYMFIDGMVLISSVLNFQTFQHAPGNELAYINYLPSYAITAWYYGRVPHDKYPDVVKFAEEARQFAQGEYAHALLVGDALDEESFQKFARKVQFYTGLSEEYIKQSRLKINKFRFLEEFLKSQTKVIGRFDCRISGPNTLQWCSGYSYDPSLELYLGPYTAAFNHYVRSDLKWDSPEEYVILATNIKWDFTKATNKYLDVSGDVLEAMTKNGRLKLFIGNGYYDLALPYASTVYTLNHMGLTPEQHKKVTLKEYEGGHMMYHDKKNLELLKRDLADFY